MGDTVSDAPPGQPTRCVSSVSFTLGAATENLTLTGTATIDGTGNPFANVLHRQCRANTLTAAAARTR